MHGIKQNPLGDLPDNLLVRQAAPAAADDASHVLGRDAAPPQTWGEELSAGRLPLAPQSDIAPTGLKEWQNYPKPSPAGMPPCALCLCVVFSAKTSSGPNARPPTLSGSRAVPNVRWTETAKITTR